MVVLFDSFTAHPSLVEVLTTLAKYDLHTCEAVQVNHSGCHKVNKFEPFLDTLYFGICFGIFKVFNNLINPVIQF